MILDSRCRAYHLEQLSLGEAPAGDGGRLRLAKVSSIWALNTGLSRLTYFVQPCLRLRQRRFATPCLPSTGIRFLLRCH